MIVFKVTLPTGTRATRPTTARGSQSSASWVIFYFRRSSTYVSGVEIGSFCDSDNIHASGQVQGDEGVLQVKGMGRRPA